MRVVIAEDAALLREGLTRLLQDRWTGRTLRVEIEGWVDPDLPVRDADALGRRVATALAR